MKYFLILVFALSFIIPVNAQEQTKPTTTTYYLIRHAEKDRSDKTNRNPSLNDVGALRAEKWSKVFEKVDFDAIYSTKYYRTLETANPTAKAKDLKIKFYEPRNLYSEEFAEATYGQTVLVVGHSNTTPAFVNAILGEKKYEDIDDNDNSYLFIVTISNDDKSTQVLKIN